MLRKTGCHVPRTHGYRWERSDLLKPLISVILPNYNYQRYLRERFQSILNQTEQRFELIYIDDGSSDQSNAIAEEFTSDPRVGLTPHSDNSGKVYQRWNEGAEEAQGEWLWFAGADDAAEPQFLEKMLETVSGDKTIAIAHCRTIRMDAEGRIVADRWHGDPEVFELLSRTNVIQGTDVIGMLCGGCFLMSASAMLLKRRVFLESGGFDIRLRQSADWDLYLNMLNGHSLAYLDSPLASYRVHNQAVTSSTNVIVRITEDLYSLTRAWEWVQNNPRVTAEVRSQVERRVRAKMFDFFVDSKAESGPNLRFAVEYVASIMPDRRWKAVIDLMDAGRNGQ